MWCLGVLVRIGGGGGHQHEGPEKDTLKTSKQESE